MTELQDLQLLAQRSRRITGPVTGQRARASNSDGDWYRVSNQAGERAQVYIYGAIGSDFGDGVTADAFVKDLNAVTASNIDLHINSPGGMVWDAVAIYSALLNHPANVDVTIDGVAASAASFVAMAGDTRVIEKPATMMIHDAHGLVIGNADDFREAADTFDEFSEAIAGIYADRAGGEQAEWRAAMKATTWYSANEAVDAGLAHQVANAQTTASNTGRGQLVRARARATLTGGNR